MYCGTVVVVGAITGAAFSRVGTVATEFSEGVLNRVFVYIPVSLACSGWY